MGDHNIHSLLEKKSRDLEEIKNFIKNLSKFNFLIHQKIHLPKKLFWLTLQVKRSSIPTIMWINTLNPPTLRRTARGRVTPPNQNLGIQEIHHTMWEEHKRNKKFRMRWKSFLK